MALAAIGRAIFGYFFLVFLLRVVGRRPGKQLTPFEFVLVFFLGGLMLTGIVATDVSVTNAWCQILAIAAGHLILVTVRTRSQRFAKLLDGTPLILLEGSIWRERTLNKMRISKADVMSVVRDQNLRVFGQVKTAVLERNGEISIISREDS